MKAAVAILCSLLLICAQGVLGSGAASVVAAKCSGCACKQMSCCAQPGSGSQPAPAAPACSQTESQCSWLLLASVHLLAQPEALVSDFSDPVLPSAGTTAIPLYERNCSYLI